jgi:hypothetical protein
MTAPARTLFVICFLLAACTDRAVGPTPAQRLPDRAMPAKATGNPSVTGADPASGHEGDVGRQVTITGSGFSAGAVAAWERNGQIDDKIRVRSTVVVRSTQLIATIDISADAALALYDISVTTLDRKKGIGTEMFEVTTAMSIGTLGGDTFVFDVYDNADAVGYGNLGGTGNTRAFFWSNATGMIDIGPGIAEAIDDAGSTIVGYDGSHAAVWTPNTERTLWTGVRLPISTASVGSYGRDVASDPVTGQPMLIGGAERIQAKRQEVTHPKLWVRTSDVWQKIDIPWPHSSESGAGGTVHAVNSLGQGAGVIQSTAGNQPVFWPNATSYMVLPGNGIGNALNETGTIVVGISSGASFWKRASTNDPWTGPFQLPGSCARAMGIDAQNRIIGAACRTSSNSRIVSAVFDPPYDTARYLNGLGERTDAGTVHGISTSGNVIGGSAPNRTNRINAAIWQQF